MNVTVILPSGLNNSGKPLKKGGRMEGFKNGFNSRMDVGPINQKQTRIQDTPVQVSELKIEDIIIRKIHYESINTKYNPEI